MVKNDKRKRNYVIYECSRSTKVSQTVSASNWNLSTVYRLDSETLAPIFSHGLLNRWTAMLPFLFLTSGQHEAGPKLHPGGRFFGP